MVSVVNCGTRGADALKCVFFLLTKRISCQVFLVLCVEYPSIARDGTRPTIIATVNTIAGPRTSVAAIPGIAPGPHAGTKGAGRAGVAAKPSTRGSSRPGS